ncbi:hypothetical protein ACTZGH_22265 [Enterobacter ludwigii]|uniref:hypothetical protein n=1 Tax=Enterobacter ludwigii TaxID=299767 RepID=UPI003FD32889
MEGHVGIRGKGVFIVNGNHSEPGTQAATFGLKLPDLFRRIFKRPVTVDRYVNARTAFPGKGFTLLMQCIPFQFKSGGAHGHKYSFHE